MEESSLFELKAVHFLVSAIALLNALVGSMLLNDCGGALVAATGYVWSLILSTKAVRNNSS